MLYYERMNVQHEDVGFVSEDGTYGPRKPSMEMHLANSVILNEKSIRISQTIMLDGGIVVFLGQS